MKKNKPFYAQTVEVPHTDAIWPKRIATMVVETAIERMAVRMARLWIQYCEHKFGEEDDQ